MQISLTKDKGMRDKLSWIFLAPPFAALAFGFFSIFGVPDWIGLSIRAAHVGFWVCAVLSWFSVRKL